MIRTHRRKVIFFLPFVLTSTGTIIWFITGSDSFQHNANTVCHSRNNGTQYKTAAIYTTIATMTFSSHTFILEDETMIGLEWGG